MGNYYIGRYQTGLVNSVDAAHDLLEEKIESLDPTVNPIIGVGVLLTRRDREQAIGWLLWSGINILWADHALVDGGALTLKELTVVAPAAHIHAAGAVVLKELTACADAYHVNASGNLTLTQDHSLAVDSGAHVNASGDLTITTNP